MKNRYTSGVAQFADLDSQIDELVIRSQRPLRDIAAASLRLLITQNSTLSKLVQYCVDIAGDQFMSEEFYQRYPELLDFLAASGCDNEEVLFQAWIKQHPDIFHCKTYNCNGTIVGGCPQMYCNNCGRKYFLHIDTITDILCARCIAQDMGECTEESRTRRYHIYTV